MSKLHQITGIALYFRQLSKLSSRGCIYLHLRIRLSSMILQDCACTYTNNNITVVTRVYNVKCLSPFDYNLWAVRRNQWDAVKGSLCRRTRNESNLWRGCYIRFSKTRWLLALEQNQFVFLREFTQIKKKKKRFNSSRGADLF